jgi:hypothetical protein
VLLEYVIIFAGEKSGLDPIHCKQYTFALVIINLN